MAITITIAGTDRTTSCLFQSLSVTNTIAANADVAEIRIVVQPGAGWRPQAGNEVIVTNGTTREFAGILMEVTEQGSAGPQLKYLCHCRDYLHLFNKRLVIADSTELAGSSAPKANQVVAGIVALSTDGFSSTGVMAAPSVPTQRFDYVAPGDAVRSLADAVNYGWWIDYNKVVNFVSTVTMAAPVATINLDSDVTNYGSLDITESVTQLKTRVYVKDWQQKSSITYNRTFTGDGSSRFFLYGYEPSAIADVSATINGTALTVMTDQVDASPGDGIGSSSAIYVCFDNLGLRFGNYAPTSTEVLSITSNYMTPGLTFVEDLTAQTTAGVREGGDGVHEYALADPGLTASDGSNLLAQARGNSVLSRDAYARISGKFVSYTQGWRAGQSFVLNSTTRMTGSLPKTVYVQQVTKRLINSGSTAVQASTGPLLFYQIEFSDGALSQ